jgi:hypothetical protein
MSNKLRSFNVNIITTVLQRPTSRLRQNNHVWSFGLSYLQKRRTVRAGKPASASCWRLQCGLLDPVEETVEHSAAVTWPQVQLCLPFTATCVHRATHKTCEGVSRSPCKVRGSHGCVHGHNNLPTSVKFANSNKDAVKSNSD